MGAFNMSSDCINQFEEYGLSVLTEEEMSSDGLAKKYSYNSPHLWTAAAQEGGLKPVS